MIRGDVGAATALTPTNCGNDQRLSTVNSPAANTRNGIMFPSMTRRATRSLVTLLCRRLPLGGRKLTRPRQASHPWTIKLHELLDDGSWRDYKETLCEIALMVPEDVAFSKGEYYRQYHYKARGREAEARKNGCREDTIRTGQKLIAARAVQALRKRGVIEVEYDDANPQRKRPSRIRRAP